MAATLITRRRQEFEKWNPVNYVQNWKTPQLVITSENDFRIPYTQGIAAFTALQRRNIPSRLLIFPDENHWVLKPKNSVQWYDEVFGWMATAGSAGSSGACSKTGAARKRHPACRPLQASGCRLSDG